MNNSRKQMICLDILRIFACFSVVAVHVAIMFNIPGRIGRFMEAGSNGLGIFYILSAFLIFISLENRKVSLSKWYIKRLLRILPIYYFILVIYIIVYSGVVKSVPEDPNRIKWLSYFLCINTILPKAEMFWYNLGALSSMSIFVWFYILAPFMRKIICNWKRALIFLAASYVLLRALQHTNLLQMFAAYYYFAVGMLIYFAIREGRQKETTIISLCILVLLVLADGKGGMLYALIIGLLILYSYDVSIKNECLCNIITFVSKRTFAIYLSHATVMQLMSLAGVEKNIESMIMFAVFSVAGVFVLHGVVENTVVKLYDRFSKRSKV